MNYYKRVLLLLSSNGSYKQNEESFFSRVVYSTVKTNPDVLTKFKKKNLLRTIGLELNGVGFFFYRNYPYRIIN